MAKHLHNFGVDLDDVAAISAPDSRASYEKAATREWDAEGGKSATGKYRYISRIPAP
jgi:hypothetical protein